MDPGAMATPMDPAWGGLTAGDASAREGAGTVPSL